jgi:hypothetical protein
MVSIEFERQLAKDLFDTVMDISKANNMDMTDLARDMQDVIRQVIFVRHTEIEIITKDGFPNYRITLQRIDY